jgi:muramoyltetrapeptide carboxypeptidase
MHQPNPITSPPLLKKGDTIGIIAPARKVQAEELSPFIHWCHDQGWKVALGPHLFHQEGQLSGSIEQRVSDLHYMLQLPEVKAIWCARGGYGCAQIVDHIQWNLLQQHPKWIIGFSDVTTLHTHIHNHTGLPTLHAPMPISFQLYQSPEHRKAMALTAQFLTTGTLSYMIGPSFQKLQLDNVQMSGGNLSVLYSLMGSNSLNKRKKQKKQVKNILFLEDLDEYVYHIDRMCNGLFRSGIFTTYDMIFCGSFTEIKDHTIPFGKQVNDILSIYAQKAGIPIYFGFPSGHTDQNYPIPMLVPTSIQQSNIHFQTL